METCAICLDQSSSVSEVNINSCACVVFVHSNCFNMWRVQQNNCIICHKSLPPVPFYVKIYHISSNKIFTTVNTKKTIYWCIYAFCMYHIMVLSVDLFFHSLLTTFDDL